MSLIMFQVRLHNSSMTDFWTVNHAVSEKLTDISWVLNATTVRVMSVLTLKRQWIRDTSHLQLWGPEVSLRSLLQTGSHGLTGSEPRQVWVFHTSGVTFFIKETKCIELYTASKCWIHKTCVFLPWRRGDPGRNTETQTCKTGKQFQKKLNWQTIAVNLTMCCLAVPTAAPAYLKHVRMHPQCLLVPVSKWWMFSDYVVFLILMSHKYICF